MKKSEVKTRYEHGKYYPTINVKCYEFPGADDVQAKWPECDEETARNAAQFAYDSAVEMFWGNIQETAEYYLGKGVKVYSAGRSSGWLIVDGLPPIESWDAIQLSKWARFCKSVAEDIKYRCSLPPFLDDIDANQWYLPGSERYNYKDTANGTICIAEMKAKAIAAGFGPIVR